MSQQFPKAPFAGPVRLMPGAPDTGGPLPGATSPSLTYEPFYGLKEKPFSLSADPRFLYRSPAHAPAFDELLNGIRRREGLIVLTGDIGTGKTTLIRSVLQHLDRRTFTAFVPDPFVSREDLLKMLLVDFGVVSVADLKRGSLAGASRPDLSYPLYEFLDSLVPLQAFAVLIIDEAQNLPLPLLEEIRILSDLEQREKLLQVVLVGQPELRVHLKLPEMRQVDQRVSVRCELSALGLEDVSGYIRHRLDVAGGGESRVEFSEAAIGAVFSASGGVPRVINLVCDRALQRGLASGAIRIGPKLVEEAITGLGLAGASADVHARDSGSGLPVVGATPDARAPVEVRTLSWAETPAPRVTTAPGREAEPVDFAPQMLSEFAAETEPSVALERRVGLWRLSTALLLATVVGAIGAALWYVSVTTGLDAPASPPPAPPWTTAHPATSLPPAAIDALDEALPSSPTRAVVAPAPDAKSYAIQVASFGSRDRADRLLSELAGAGFLARAVEFDLGPAGGLLLQIRVDGYQTVEDADRDLLRIRALPGYADAHLLTN